MSTKAANLATEAVECWVQVESFHLLYETIHHRSSSTVAVYLYN